MEDNFFCSKSPFKVSANMRLSFSARSTPPSDRTAHRPACRSACSWPGCGVAAAISLILSKDKKDRDMFIS